MKIQDDCWSQDLHLSVKLLSLIYHNQSQIFSRTALDMATYFKKKYKTHNMPQMEGWYLRVAFFFFSRDHVKLFVW